MTGTPVMTHQVRELVWGISSSVAVITALSRRIDEHVRAVNAARAELAERLVRLDALAAAAGDPGLQAFLGEKADVRLPMVDEHLPERLYPS